MNFLNFSEILSLNPNKKILNELIIAIGLFFFIEGLLYAIFPSKMKNMLLKLNDIKDGQLRVGGLIFLIIGFFIIWFFKS